MRKSAWLLGAFTFCGVTLSLNTSVTAWPVFMSRVPNAMETCFSPKQDCERLLVGYLDSAQSSLDIAIYSFSHRSVADAIIRAHSRGIKVRVLVDRDQSRSKSSLVGTLIKEKIEVKYGDVEGIMHHKFTIVDGRMVQTGSFNYTWTAATKSAENQIYLSDPMVVMRFKNEFDRLFAEGIRIKKRPSFLEESTGAPFGDAAGESVDDSVEDTGDSEISYREAL